MDVTNAADIMFPEKHEVFKNASLSANTVAERGNGLTVNIQRQRICVAH